MKLKIHKDGKEVSYMLLTKLPNGDIEIEFSKTDPKYRNRGFASLLLTKAKVMADKMHKNLVTVIDPDNSGGLTYQQEFEWLVRHGFKPVRKYEFEKHNFKNVMIYHNVEKEKNKK